jgi:outer membrane protein assembly factor BamB
MAAIVLLAGVDGSAADWPQARGDAARSGYTAESLPEAPSLRWTVEERLPPQPAWRSSDRMPYDRAFQAVAAGERFFYGTSSDCRVVARNVATGRVLWTYVTDAPVRFAPVIWQDRVLVASDDGFLYCLDAADGRVHWKMRGGPKADLVLGNDRMISRWPVRGGPVVVDGTAYFGAGIWPSEGVYIYAVDAATGKVQWCNDSSGSLEMDQPHPGARAKSGVAAQGYLAAEGGLLLVPTGRAVPAAFDRATGKFQYLRLGAAAQSGGSEVAAIDGHVFNGGAMFATATGLRQQSLGGRVGKKRDPLVHDFAANVQVAAHPRWIVYSSGNQLTAMSRQNLLVEKDAVGDRGKKVRTKVLAEPAWKRSLPGEGFASLIVAGDSIVAGRQDQVLVLDAASGQTKWSAEVRGVPYGLAVSRGRLYVSTDRGTIHCFDGGKAVPAVIRLETPPPATKTDPAYAAAAEEILRRTGVAAGYCLDLACGDGYLALELARRTNLQIYAVESDPAKVQAARQRFEALGLYGVRVTVHAADPAGIRYPDYFADLVVSGRSVLEGPAAVPQAVVSRVLRPYGGIACWGRAGAMQQSSRGPLAAAGDWTHLYADAANTLCSGDARLRAPLAMLWFRDTDFLMPSRHGRGPAPLVAGGRMYVEGLDGLRAVNIYNGSTLWEFPMPKLLQPYHQDHLTGVAATGSNLCLGDDRVYVHVGDKCLVLDAKTGRKTAEWTPPRRPDGKPGTWGYLAYRNGMLFGTLVNEEHLVKESWRSYLGKLDMSHIYSESVLLFALDGKTGQCQWTWVPQCSIRHNAIAAGAKRLYLMDRALVTADTPTTVPKAARDAPSSGRLLCLDSRTGKVLWEVREDVFGTLLALSEKHDVLLMAYQPTAFPLDSERGDRMAAYRASDGKRLWCTQARYGSRPVLNDQAVYAEPGKWDLLSGARLPFRLTRSYGCGILAGSERLLVFRSATLGYVDLGATRGTENYGGIRPGCWINAIPAGGLVLMADAASWCSCSYLNQATIALRPCEE